MKEEFKLNLNTHVVFVIQKIKQPEKNFNSTFHYLKFLKTWWKHFEIILYNNINIIWIMFYVSNNHSEENFEM